VRFPTDGNVGGATFSIPSTEESRRAAITGLLGRAHAALQPLGVKLAADVFGYTSWVPDDLGIGQHLETIAPYLDVICPMVYPSTYSSGLPGDDPKYDFAIAYPYDIVHKSTLRTFNRMKEVNPNIEVRPWLQDFRDYAFDTRLYTVAEIRAQMDGARHGGGRGWLLWDPAVRYTPEALVSANPSYTPNVRGRVLVLSYGEIGEAQDAEAADKSGARTPDALRADLERLLAGGYFPVNMSEMVGDKLNVVPAGKRPVVLTFDGSTEGQFRLRADGSPDPETAVGVLAAMHAANPVDWPLRATFFVRQAEGRPGEGVFGSGSAEAAQKLRLLIDMGMEVGVQAFARDSLDGLSDGELQSLLGGPKVQIESLLEGYSVQSIALPDESYLRNPSLVQSGVAAGTSYVYVAAVLPDGGLAESPQVFRHDPYCITRSPVGTLEAALIEADIPGLHYVSAGE
jgi:hypothetical protein